MAPPPLEMHKKMCDGIDALFAARMASLQTRVAPTSDQKAEWDTFFSFLSRDARRDQVDLQRGGLRAA